MEEHQLRLLLDHLFPMELEQMAILTLKELLEFYSRIFSFSQQPFVIQSQIVWTYPSSYPLVIILVEL